MPASGCLARPSTSTCVFPAKMVVMAPGLIGGVRGSLLGRGFRQDAITDSSPTAKLVPSMRKTRVGLTSAESRRRLLTTGAGCMHGESDSMDTSFAHPDVNAPDMPGRGRARPLGHEGRGMYGRDGNPSRSRNQALNLIHGLSGKSNPASLSVQQIGGAGDFLKTFFGRDEAKTIPRLNPFRRRAGD